MTEDYEGLKQVHSEGVHYGVAVGADGGVDAGDDHVQEGGGHPLQLLYQTLILTIELCIVGLALTVSVIRCEVRGVRGVRGCLPGSCKGRTLGRLTPAA